MMPKIIKLKELQLKRRGSIDPSKYPSETFTLYSIPAYDNGEPQLLTGAEIGSAKQLVSNGDVLISKIVPHIRRAWVVSDDYGNRQIASGEWIVFNSEKIVPEFFRHYLLSDVFHQKFMMTVAGVGGSLLRAQPRLVADFDFRLPPIAEQKRIAELLDTASNVLRLREKAIEKLDELAQSVFSEIENKSSEYVELEKLVLKPKLKSEKQVSRVWSLSLEQIESNTGKLTKKNLVDAGQLGTSTFYFEPPVVLYSKLRPYLNKVYMPEESGYATTELIPLYCNQSKVVPEYLASMLMSKKFVEYATVNSGGAKMPRMIMDKFWDYKVALADIDAQREFKKTYSAIQKERELMQRDLQKLQELSSSLQHQSFAVN